MRLGRIRTYSGTDSGGIFQIAPPTCYFSANVGRKERPSTVITRFTGKNNRSSVNNKSAVSIRQKARRGVTDGGDFLIRRGRLVNKNKLHRARGESY